MRAKCPHCQNGCEECEGGFISVELAFQYALLVCNVCGRGVGGRAYGEGFPPLPEKPNPLAICPSCDTNNLRYEA